MKLENIHEEVHSLDDIDIMVNNELDRNKTIEVNENYLVYAIVELLILTLVLIMLMHVMYRCKFKNGKRNRNKKISFMN